MIFSGLELMGDVPFRDVIIYSTVLAPDGRRMSKSLGTGIDPTEIDRRARRRRDPLRPAEDVVEPRTSASRSARSRRARRLANKLWNVARLILGEHRGRAAGGAPAGARGALDPRPARRRTRAAVEEHLGEFDYAKVADGALPPDLRRLLRLVRRGDQAAARTTGDEDARATALAALERLLKLLHPAMPHVTEEIWSNLPDRETRLIVAPWPEADDRLRGRRRCARAGADRGRRSSAAARCRPARRRTSGASSRRSCAPTA